MYRFLEDLKTYIEYRFQNDSDISVQKKPKVYNGYQIQHSPSSKNPEIQIQPLNKSETIEYTTFCGKRANSIPVQITALCGQMKIAKIDYSAQDASVVFGDKIDTYVYDYIYGSENKNLYGGRMITVSPALPINDGGSMYATSVRFDFIVAHPYVAG